MAQARSGFAAVFIDFENIYYFLRNEYGDIPDLNDYVFAILRGLRERLESRHDLHAIIQKAYADFERIGTTPQGSLYLMGIDTHNVLGTDHKNAADMRLTIDAMEILYTRPEIGTFVFLAGDRDYIPVVQHLKKQAKEVLVAAFRDSASGDLLLNVGEENYIEASQLIDEKLRRRLEVVSRERGESERRIAQARASTSVSPAPSPVRASTDPESSSARVESAGPSGTSRTSPLLRDRAAEERDRFGKMFPVTDETQRSCLELIVTQFGHFPEVFLSPFLRRLSDAFPRLADYERKNLLIDLETAGAIRIEKRRGEPNDYSVMLINRNHPTVQELNP